MLFLEGHFRLLLVAKSGVTSARERHWVARMLGGIDSKISRDFNVIGANRYGPKE